MVSTTTIWTVPIRCAKPNHPSHVLRHTDRFVLVKFFVPAGVCESRLICSCNRELLSCMCKPMYEGGGIVANVCLQYLQDSLGYYFVAESRDVCLVDKQRFLHIVRGVR